MSRGAPRLAEGLAVRVAMPNLAHEGASRWLDGTTREEIGVILSAYRPGTRGGLYIVRLRMADRVLVGLSTWIVGEADAPGQLGLWA